MTLQQAPAGQSPDGVVTPEGVLPTLPPHDVFYRQLVTDTCAVIGDGCQQRLRTAPIVIAGCGAVGGSVVEPLVRLGAERLILVDAGTYRISDLGRAPIRLRDVGRNKAEALAERVREINPYATVNVESRGVTEATARALVLDAALIVDGLGTGGAARRWLHRHARELRVPVVQGIEDGGRCGVVVHDYRRPARADVAASPAQTAGDRRSRARSGGPRAGYTPALVGTLALPAILALVAGEPVVRRVAVDPCALAQPARARLRRWLGGVRRVRR
jgi:hypothetical protein